MQKRTHQVHKNALETQTRHTHRTRNTRTKHAQEMQKHTQQVHKTVMETPPLRKHTSTQLVHHKVLETIQENNTQTIHKAHTTHAEQV